MENVFTSSRIMLDAKLASRPGREEAAWYILFAIAIRELWLASTSESNFVLNQNLVYSDTVEPLYNGHHWGMRFWPL